MTKINTNFKASAAEPLGGRAELLRRLEEANEQIEVFKRDNAEHLSEESFLELERIHMMIIAESAAIAAYGVGGGGSVGGASAPGDDSPWRPQELAPGWNGVRPEHINESDPIGRQMIAADPAKYGEFAGTVEIESSGNPEDPTKIAFQMTDEMSAVYAESRGKDVILTVVYQDNRRESYRVVDLTTRPEDFIISAQGVSHGVTIDLSRVFRISDGVFSPLGTRARSYIHGSEFGDTLRGGLGDDVIIGYGGDDFIRGGPGNDLLYGDEYYERSGMAAAGGGDDDIGGGLGEDIIYGGTGLDTWHTSDWGESINPDMERQVNDILSEPPDIDDGWFSSTGDAWAAEIDDNGEVVIRKESGDRNTDLILKMPPGYTMASAEMDADGSLVITFGGEGTDASGNRVFKSFRVRIEDFFKPGEGITRLNFIGGEGDEIIDFSRIECTNQVINIASEGGADIILNVKYKILAEGVDIENLTTSQRNSNAELEGFAEGILSGYSNNEGEQGGYIAYVEDGRIVIDRREPAAQAAETIRISAPTGYDRYYIAIDENENCVYVILVNPNEDGRAETIVVKIDAELLGRDDEGNIDDSRIVVGNMTTTGEGAERQDRWERITDFAYISLDELDYLVEGGDGSDMIFTQRGAKVESDGDDHVIEGDPSPPEDE